MTNWVWVELDINVNQYVSIDRSVATLVFFVIKLSKYILLSNIKFIVNLDVIKLHPFVFYDDLSFVFVYSKTNHDTFH